MIPEASEIPSYALNKELAKQMNEDAAAGISTGGSSRIKLSGKQFVLVDGNGNERTIKAGELFMAPDGNAYLPAVVLRAKKEIQKSWYAGAFNPNEEGQSPDCFSNDGLTPESSAPMKQCDSCAACPQNAYGSGKDQAGNATRGKACSDNKILAVFCMSSVYKLKLPPASLKNFGMFVKELTARGIPVGNVKVLLGFAETATFPVITFKFGGFVPENALEKLYQLSTSEEAEQIAHDTITASAKALPALPRNTKDPVKAASTPSKAPDKPAPADDFGMNLFAVPSQEEPKVAAKVEATAEVSLSDADLAAKLGL